MVDEDRTPGQAMNHPVIAEHDLLHVRGVGDTDHDDVALLSEFDRIGGEVTDEIDCLPGSPVPDREAVPGQEKVGAIP